MQLIPTDPLVSIRDHFFWEAAPALVKALYSAKNARLPVHIFHRLLAF